MPSGDARIGPSLLDVKTKLSMGGVMAKNERRTPCQAENTQGRLTTETRRRGDAEVADSVLDASDHGRIEFERSTPCPAEAGGRTAGPGSVEPREVHSRNLWNNPMRFAYAPKSDSMVRSSVPRSAQRRSGGLPTDTRCQRPTRPSEPAIDRHRRAL
jgi:hypothetical protein